MLAEKAKQTKQTKQTSCRNWPRHRRNRSSVAGRQAQHAPPHSLRQRLSLFDGPLASVDLLKRRPCRKQERIQSDRALEVRGGATPPSLGIVAAPSTATISASASAMPGASAEALGFSG